MRRVSLSKPGKIETLIISLAATRKCENCFDLFTWPLRFDCHNKMYFITIIMSRVRMTIVIIGIMHVQWSRVKYIIHFIYKNRYFRCLYFIRAVYNRQRVCRQLLRLFYETVLKIVIINIIKYILLF